ncbi:MAG: thiol reductant ABC exporter subunit CydD, partial [Anaerolineales bacterium]|nr:thiol reductant ABC exporter subunit CydD [Anaerolineales bacterium]
MKLINPRLLKQAAASRWLLVLVILAGLSAGLLTVAQAYQTSQVIAAVFLAGAGLAAVSPGLVALLLLYSFKSAALWAGEILAGQVAQQVKLDLRQRLYHHVQQMGHLDVRRQRSGELVNTLSSGVEALDAYFRQYLPQLVLAALVPLTFLFFVFPRDRLSGLVLLLTAPLIPVFMILIAGQAERLTQRQWRTLSRMSAHFLDVLQGLETLKILGQSQAQLAVIRQISSQFRDRTMQVLRVAFLSALALELIATLGTAVAAVEIGLRLLYGRLAFEQALFVLLLAPEFYLPLRLLGTRFHAGMAGIQAAGRIFEILDCPVSAQAAQLDGHEAARLATVPGVIFVDVTYRYQAGQAALEQVSFEIQPGECVALVGPSGAGKSTLAQILAGFLMPQSGQVCLTGADGSREPGRAGRAAWLSQEPYLFYDSVAANIRLGVPQATLEQVRAAARQARADAFIMALPQGYDTVVGERGARLSAGQAQRIALARALLMAAPLLILDEPAAHFDPELQASFDAALAELRPGRTVLVIAHRLQTAQQADRVIVLDQGRVVQSGQHTDLAQQPGLYRRMLHGQVEQSPVLDPEPVAAWRAGLDAPGRRWVPLPVSESGTGRPALLRLFAFLLPLRGWIVLSALLGFLTIASSIALLGTSAYLISAAALQPSIAALQVAIVGVRAFGLSRGLLRYLERLVSHQTTFRVLARLRAWFYQQLEPLAPARLQQYRSADLLTRIVADIDSLENFYVRVVAPPLAAILVALLAGGLLWPYGFELALTLWVFLVLAGLLLPWWMYRLAARGAQGGLQARADLNIALLDGIQGLPDLLAYGRAGDQRLLVHDFSRQLAAYQAFHTRRAALIEAGMNLVSNLGAWGVLLLAIQRVEAGQVAGVYLAALLLVAWAAFEAVQGLPVAAQYLQENLQAAGRLFDIVAQPPAVPEPDMPAGQPASTDLQIRGLSFRYLQAEQPIAGTAASGWVLQAVDLELEAGKRIALVGPSGAGKTSLLHVLLRFWDYERGSIQLGGQELRQLPAALVRQRLAVVSQRTYLFNTSLRENVLLAQPQASPAQIEQALALAGLQDFVAQLPQGLETVLGEQGLRLSGGERQ